MPAALPQARAQPTCRRATTRAGRCRKHPTRPIVPGPRAHERRAAPPPRSPSPRESRSPGPGRTRREHSRERPASGPTRAAAPEPSPPPHATAPGSSRAADAGRPAATRDAADVEPPAETRATPAATAAAAAAAAVRTGRRGKRLDQRTSRPSTEICDGGGLTAAGALMWPGGLAPAAPSPPGPRRPTAEKSARRPRYRRRCRARHRPPRSPGGSAEPHGEAAHGADAVGVVDLVSARWAND